MLASLALLSLLQTPILGADGDPLSVGDVHLTYGLLGPTRTETKVRPGDSLGLSFEIRGITTDDAGKASYSLAIEVLDTAGKAILRQEPRKEGEILVLGGGILPAYAQVDLALDSPIGEYTLKVIVTDLANKKTAIASQKFQVTAKDFDIVRLTVSGDSEALVPIVTPSPGQPYWVHAAVVGFDRAKEATKQPKVEVQLRVLDENGKPLVATPFAGTIDKDVPGNASSLSFKFFLPLNRPGKYWVELSAKDGLKKTSAVQKFPITVISAK